MGSVSPQQATALVSSGCVTSTTDGQEGGLTHQSLLSHVLEAAGLRCGHGQGFSPGRADATPSLCPRVVVCVLLSSPYEERQSDRIRPPVTLFHLNHFGEDSVSKYSEF